MKKKRSRFGIIPIVIALLIIAILVGASFIVYQSRHKNNETDTATSFDTSALMTVTSSGGLCNGPCNHPVYNLYDNGKFEGYKSLSVSEVSQLKNIINDTDFTQYAPNPNPHCESFVDGSDQVLLFPQKYGDKTFTTCMLNIPKNDNAFSYITKLLESHSNKQN